MKTLIKNAQLVYPGHSLHRKKIDVLVQNGKILEINPKTSKHKKLIESKGLLIFPGLVDMFCQTGEPGFEDKEDFDSLTSAAKAGGFSRLCLLPDADPITDSKSEVSYVEKASGLNGVHLHSIGAISKELKGEELSEMYDMAMAGAVGFSDAKHPIEDVNMMRRALDYSKGFDGLVYSFPIDNRVAPGGMVNESEHNTSLGLKSTPELAEELMVNRDIYLLSYTQSKLHFATLSSKGSVSLVEQAKKKGLRLSAGTSLAHLLFSEQSLATFDTNYKLTPPLRTEKDRKVLRNAVKKGIIDIIHSDHSPQIIENKDVEFDQAAYGMIMLETFIAAYNMELSKEIDWEAFIQASSLNPRKILDIPAPELKEGAPFEFTLFSPTEKWTYTNGQSKAKNSPYFNSELTGKVIEVN